MSLNTNQPDMLQLPPGYAPDVLAFFDAWSALRAGAIVPRLSDYLDHAPPKLQPFVSIVDVHGPDKVLVRLFGTGMVGIVGHDFTKKDLTPIYSAKDLARVGAIAWQSVIHPAGYLCVRTVKTGHGLVLDCDCICLPLAVQTPLPKCMITFVSFPKQMPRRPGLAELGTVMAVRFVSWIDLGAGIPPPPSSAY